MPSLEEIISAKETIVNKLFTNLVSEDFALIKESAELLVYNFKDDRVIPQLLALIANPKMQGRTAYLVSLCSECGEAALKVHWREFLELLLYANYPTSLNAAHLIEKLHVPFEENTEELKAIVEHLQEIKGQLINADQRQNLRQVIVHLEACIALQVAQEETALGETAPNKEEVSLYWSFYNTKKGAYIDELQQTIPTALHRSWKTGQERPKFGGKSMGEYSYNNCIYRLPVTYEQVEEGLLDFYQIFKDHFSFIQKLKAEYQLEIGLTIVHQDRAELLSFAIPEEVVTFVDGIGGYIELD